VKLVQANTAAHSALQRAMTVIHRLSVLQ